jgi:hypothetical protein
MGAWRMQAFGRTGVLSNGATRHDGRYHSVDSSGGAGQVLGNTAIYGNSVIGRRYGDIEILTNGRTCQTFGNMRHCN